MACVGGLYLGIFRGIYRLGGEIGDYDGWAVSHTFALDPDPEDVVFAHFVIHDWFVGRWSQAVPFMGSPLSNATILQTVRVERIGQGQVQDAEVPDAAPAGPLDPVGLLPLQCSLLVLARTRTLGLGGRLYLPGLDKRWTQAIASEFAFQGFEQWLADWWRPRTVFGTAVTPVVHSAKHDLCDVPDRAVIVVWPRTQRRRSKRLPSPFVEVPL